MTLYISKKIGQSRHELMLAIFFSFFLHAAIVALALVFMVAVRPKIYVPPFYQVKLVGLPEQMTEAPAGSEAPVPPKQESPPIKEKPHTALKYVPQRPVQRAPKQNVLPELTEKKQPKTVKESASPEAEKASTQQSPPTASIAKPEGRTVGVAVSTSSEDFQFPPYLAIVRDQIEQHWNPPPGAKGVKAKVQFTVLRSGRVGDTQLLDSSGNFYFDQAAVRAILMSSPLPPMPEGFFKDYAVFTVDLQEKD